MPPAPRLVRLLVQPALHDARIIACRRFNGLGGSGSFGFRFRTRRRILQPSHLNVAATPFSRRLGLRSAGGGVWRSDRAGGAACSWAGVGASCGCRRAWCRWLAMRNEVVIARCARPRRRIRRQPAGPMRPTIGDITATCAQHHGERQDGACGQKPFDNHICRRSVEPDRRMPRAPLTIVSDRAAGH